MDKRNIYHCYRLYKDADDKCQNLIAQIKPFLNDFTTKHNVDAISFNDVTVLYGPGMAEYDYFKDNHPDLYEKWRSDTVSVYNLKWSGAMFVIEYMVPKNAFMVYKHEKYDIPTDVAGAINDLYDAQEKRKMIYTAYRGKRMSARIIAAKNNKNK